MSELLCGNHSSHHDNRNGREPCSPPKWHEILSGRAWRRVTRPGGLQCRAATRTLQADGPDTRPRMPLRLLLTPLEYVKLDKSLFPIYWHSTLEKFYACHPEHDTLNMPLRGSTCHESFVRDQFQLYNNMIFSCM